MAKAKSKADEKLIKVKIELSAKEKANPELAKGRVSGDYEVKPEEANAVHVELEKTKFDFSTGEKKSKPTVQQFNDRAWLQFRKNAKNLGFTHIRVLHAPEGTDRTVVDNTMKNPNKKEEAKAEA